MTTIRRERGRQAFTLIELLVVISIIAILMGLTTAAVQRVRIAGKRATVSNEISQMGSALANLQRDRGNTPIPSVIVLREKMNYDSNNAVEVASANYLKQSWPQIPEHGTSRSERRRTDFATAGSIRPRSSRLPQRNIKPKMQFVKDSHGNIVSNQALAEAGTAFRDLCFESPNFRLYPNRLTALEKPRWPSLT